MQFGSIARESARNATPGEPATSYESKSGFWEQGSEPTGWNRGGDMGARRVAAVADSHEHDWHVVQVDFDAGKPVSEYACSMCSEVWFS